ncbi:MAG: GPR endopeptidase [Bacillota bacterium]|nr:GPR endopeptidase [Bacillota bacterium]HOC06054.1 GPR endopeptidase [Bacillota bacterium]HPZ21555.1 GPR endopeptidase [Bacillota bacterium]HQD19578.1 GPR endopeptidase [Bacillota bacterium]
MFRTDLVLEAHEIFLQTSELPELAGVETKHQSLEGIDVSVTNILTADAAAKIGKGQGKYITIEATGLREKNEELETRLVKVLGRELQGMLNLNGNSKVLVVGLGNWNVTPDALGPSVVEKIYVTRHLKAMYPDKIGPGFRDVCAIAPGVLGLTGIETGEIIIGIVQRIRPDIVIAIDALAARSLRRLNTTIQISDTGIYPGSGVGNKREGVTRENLGIPVIALGVPTVVDAATLTGDVLDLLIRAAESEAKIPWDIKVMLSALEKFSLEDKKQLIKEVLNPEVGVLMVTPKEVDRLLKDISDLLANGLNAALHPRVAQEYLN